MYKLIALDLDGTTLNHYGEVTEKTKQTLKEIKDKGIEIVVASGRTIDSIKTIAKEIDATNYMIAGNGAVVYDIQNDEVIYQKYISKVKALKIINLFEENSITYSVYTDRTIVANALKYNVLYYYKENLKKEEEKKTSLKIVENIYEYVKNMENEQVMKIMIADETEMVFNSIVRKLNEYVDDIEVLDVSHMSRKIIKIGSEEIPLEYYYTEISEKDVDKWYAIEFLMEKLGINKEEVIAIGDNVNDIKMVTEAGCGIAMKGSTPKLTEKAKIITKFTNNEDRSWRNTWKNVTIILQKYYKNIKFL